MKSKKITKAVTMTVELAERLEKAAKADNRSFSNLVETKLQKALEKKELTPA